MKWPLAPVVLCLAGGIVAGDVCGIHWGLLAILLVSLCTAFVWKRHVKAIVLGTILFLFGLGDYLLHTEVFSETDLRVVLRNEAQIATVEGVIAEPPQERFVKTRRGIEQRFSCVLKAEQIQLDGEWFPVEGKVYVQAPMALLPGLHNGKRVQVTGNIHPPDSPSVPDGLDFREYLARHGIYFQLQTSRMEDWNLLETGATPTWPERFTQWGMERIQGPLPLGDENVMLLQAMGLGWKEALMPEVKEPFVRSGTMHLFAISGLHVALIALMLVQLLLALGVPRQICGGILIPLLWFYTASIGWQASAMRSAIMMTVIGVGWMLERPSNILNSLAAGAALILAVDPQQLFQPGFQLSFMVVLSLGLLVPPMEEWRQKVFRPDPFLPDELRPRWQRWLDWPVRFLTMNAVTSFAAWLGSLPLIAYYFHLVTPVALIANLVVVPLGSLALISCFGALLMAWCPPIADLFSYAAWILMKWMVGSSEWFADWPGAWWPVLKPSWGVFLSYYVLLFSLFAMKWKSPRRWLAAGLAGLTLITLLWSNWQTRREEIRLTILDVRGGDAHVFEGGRYYPPLVVDAASEGGYDSALKPFLLSRGIKQVPELLLTHGDARHVGGAPALLDDYRVRLLVTSPVKSLSPGYRQLLEEWDGKKRPHTWVTNGSAYGPWKVLHPEATDRFSKGDDNAVVLRGEFRGVSVLLLSDLGRLGQKALVERHPDLHADIVVTGIPGKEEPVRDELLAAVQPQVIVVTCANQPAGEQASPSLRARLSSGPWEVYYVSEAGSVTFSFADGACWLQPMRGSGMVVWRNKPR